MDTAAHSGVPEPPSLGEGSEANPPEADQERRSGARAVGRRFTEPAASAEGSGSDTVEPDSGPEQSRLTKVTVLVAKLTTLTVAATGALAALAALAEKIREML